MRKVTGGKEHGEETATLVFRDHRLNEVMEMVEEWMGGIEQQMMISRIVEEWCPVTADSTDDELEEMATTAEELRWTNLAGDIGVIDGEQLREALKERRRELGDQESS